MGQLFELFIKSSDIESLKWLYSKDPEYFKNISMEDYIYDVFNQKCNLTIYEKLSLCYQYLGLWDLCHFIFNYVNKFVTLYIGF